MAGGVSSDAAKENRMRAFLSEKRGPGTMRRFHRMALSS
jgi:hypothetical protein